jgi:hypothetical protein
VLVVVDMDFLCRHIDDVVGAHTGDVVVNTGGVGANILLCLDDVVANIQPGDVVVNTGDVVGNTGGVVGYIPCLICHRLFLPPLVLNLFLPAPN